MYHLPRLNNEHPWANRPHDSLTDQAESKGVISEVKTQSRRARRLLKSMPYCMSLTQRMRVFEHLVKTDKAGHQPENAPGIPIRVRR